ncbi:MAG: hypothetical protein H6685_09670 [Deltaproteobacteria bacterium]|nr:hypothetical protein [Deltaproteobacteria bacterium]
MMNDLLTRLLEYARTGLDHTQVEQIHVGEMVRDIVEMLDLPTGFSVEADPSLPTLHTARTPLQQVLQNLISNAVRYNDKSDGRVRVHATHEGPWHTRISVTDNGPGIDPRFSGKVFEIFQTLRPKDEVESTGVGLAIVKKIVESLGCRVGLDSRPGFGATFHFTWPLHWPHQDDQAPPPEAALEPVPIRLDD